MPLNETLKIKLLSSLSKVFADQEPFEKQWNKGTMLCNEVCSFQVAYFWSGLWKKNIRLRVNSVISPCISIREVCLIPCEMPCYANHDDNYLRTDPGLFPDLLVPLKNGELTIVPNQWRALWITVNPDAEPIKPGTYKIEVLFYDVSEPVPEPAPMSEPEPVPASVSEPVPAPAPVSVSVSEPVPAPAPISVSEPETVSELAPVIEDKSGVNPDNEHFYGKAVFNLEVVDALLPKQKLLHTEWFHTDCIATYYNIEVFSNEYWELIGQYLDTAVKHGINMILTPIFTPPLDTAVGGERPTVQLVEIIKSEGRYSFSFDRLKRWIDLCHSKGVEFFEFSHLFTQWGAKHAPKIVANENGILKQIFGWDTDATGENYSNFLSQFLPELLNFIKLNKLEKASYFHISDEPGLEHLTQYKKASEIINKYLKDYPIIDALSDFKFYETGTVKNPIPASDHIEPFLENNVPDLWTYYCCGQNNEVSNRFISMPSARNRILGIQLYKFKIKGFLQWGFNFWYSQNSRYRVNPFRVTDGGYWVPAGDAFVVYPGNDGPLVSLRLEVFLEALQDLRALELLEAKIGREAVINLLEEGLEYPITFRKYPREAEWLLLKREQINKIIAE